jgi:hypothetical protein
LFLFSYALVEGVSMSGFPLSGPNGFLGNAFPSPAVSPFGGGVPAVPPAGPTSLFGETGNLMGLSGLGNFGNLTDTRITLQDGVTKINSSSGLLNLQIGTDGAPDVSQLSPKEIGILFNSQLGLRDAFTALPLADQVQLAEQAKTNKINDPTQLLLGDVSSMVRSSGLYDQIKALTQAEGLTSRQIYQLAVNPNISQEVRIALKMRADVQQKAASQQRQNARSIMKKMNQKDPIAEETAKKAEAAAQRANRVALGLDPEAADAGAEPSPSASSTPSFTPFK